MKKFAIAVLVFLFSLTAAQAQSMGWMNAKTGQVKYHEGLPPTERLAEFIPQIPPAQGLFQTYIAMGKTPEESMQLVLEAIIEIYEKK